MVHAKDMTNLMNDTAQLVDAIAPTSVMWSWNTKSRFLTHDVLPSAKQSIGLFQLHDDMTKQDKKES